MSFDFEAEWAKLPKGEGVTRSGGNIFACEQTDAEREAEAWSFMDTFLASYDARKAKHAAEKHVER